MKKFIIYSAIVAAFALPAIAQITQSSETISTFIVPADFQDEAVKQINALHADVADIAELVTVNTNANVNLLTVTPAFIGQVIVTPNSTNVWTDAATGATNSYLLRAAVAYGVTTNDWAKIATDK